MYAALGIHKCLPHSHGSQGCCSYHRSTLTRHYKEPVMAGTSSFTEGASVFGGGANLVQAIDNIFTLYEPDVIAVHTTCLSETIGDDIPAFAHQAKTKGSIPEGKFVIHTNTPSYVGSHVSGFANMTKSMVDYFSASTGEALNQVNIIPGFVEPADMAEIKRLTGLVGAKCVLFPDTSGVLNAPLTGRQKMYPDGGVTVPELISTGDSKVTLALGQFASLPAAEALNAKCKVPLVSLDLPIGLLATDRFVDALRSRMGLEVPEAVNVERGQLLDLATDMEQYFSGKRVALSGDPDQLIALTEFLATLGMVPAHVVTGTPGKAFERRIAEIVAPTGKSVNVKAGGDLFLLHQWIKSEPVDLLIGNTYCKYIAKDEDIPLIRMGFPVVDRIGHIYFPTVGYRGGIRLMEKILDALLDRQDRDASEENIELVM
jgi:nitrogenase molybdenum-iron protein beta chain